MSRLGKSVKGIVKTRSTPLKDTCAVQMMRSGDPLYSELSPRTSSSPKSSMVMQHIVATVSITMSVSGLSARTPERGYPYRIATVPRAMWTDATAIPRGTTASGAAEGPAQAVELSAGAGEVRVDAEGAEWLRLIS